jgi:hypothetical protein
MHHRQDLADMCVWLRWRSRIRKLPTGAGGAVDTSSTHRSIQGFPVQVASHHPVHSGEFHPWRRVQSHVCRIREFSSATTHSLAEVILCPSRPVVVSLDKRRLKQPSSLFLSPQTAPESHRSALQARRARPFAEDQRELRRAFLFLQAYHSRVSHHVAANTSLLWREPEGSQSHITRHTSSTSSEAGSR